MNRRKAIGSVALGAAAAATVRIARAADPEIEVLVNHWRKSKDLTLKVAEAMPAENYDYKPFADARVFGGELQHLGQAEGFYLGMLGKGRGPAAPRGDTSKATTVKYLTDSFDWAIGVVGQLTAADLTKAFSPGRGPSMTGLEVLYQAMIHTAHTRGYGEMYLRNKGVTPPTYDV
ncbi:MAG: DinB family protein [Acidobacteriia bacterium]|nr:DinB family protein [Terriglobia bacterium]